MSVLTYKTYSTIIDDTFKQWSIDLSIDLTTYKDTLLQAIQSYLSTDWSIVSTYLVDAFVLANLTDNVNNVVHSDNFITFGNIDLDTVKPEYITTTINTTDPTTGTVTTTQNTVLSYDKLNKYIDFLNSHDYSLETLACTNLENLTHMSSQDSVFDGIFGNPFAENTPTIDIYKAILEDKAYLALLQYLNSPLLSRIVYPRPVYVVDESMV